MAFENTQVYGSWNAGKDGSKVLVPKFRYDGGNPMVFVRDFPVVAAYYGITDAITWDDDKRIIITDDKEELVNNVAMMVIRQYVNEKVLNIIMVGRPTLAATVYRSLSTIFLTNDAVTKVHVARELYSCEMRLGDSLVDFLAKINGLMEESGRLGDDIYTGTGQNADGGHETTRTMEDHSDRQNG